MKNLLRYSTMILAAGIFTLVQAHAFNRANLRRTVGVITDGRPSANSLFREVRDVHKKEKNGKKASASGEIGPSVETITTTKTYIEGLAALTTAKNGTRKGNHGTLQASGNGKGTTSEKTTTSALAAAAAENTSCPQVQLSFVTTTVFGTGVAPVITITALPETVTQFVTITVNAAGAAPAVDVTSIASTSSTSLESSVAQAATSSTTSENATSASVTDTPPATIPAATQATSAPYTTLATTTTPKVVEISTGEVFTVPNSAITIGVGSINISYGSSADPTSLAIPTPVVVDSTTFPVTESAAIVNPTPAAAISQPFEISTYSLTTSAVLGNLASQIPHS